MCTIPRAMETHKSSPGMWALAVPMTVFSLLLGCPIKGHPTPNITWFQNGRPIATAPGLTHHIWGAGQILRVANLSGGPQGEFSCLAQNEAGTLMQKASLVIQGEKSLGLEQQHAYLGIHPLVEHTDVISGG